MDTNFSNGTTLTDADWFNDVNRLQYTILGDPADIAAVRTALGLAVGSSPTFVAVTLTNGQIVFPSVQVPSAGANTLDDYEEGTFSPGVSFGGAAVGIAYTTQSGTYTKIGNRIQVSGLITLSSKGSSTGAAIITGFPFTAGAFSMLAMRINSLNAGINGYPTLLIDNGTTNGVLQVLVGSSATIANLLDTDFSATTNIIFGGSYNV